MFTKAVHARALRRTQAGRWLPACCLALAAGCATVPALAQTLNSGQGLSASQQVAHPSSEPPLPQPEALFPTIFGAGSWLRDHGIAVLLDTTNEFFGTVSGGGGPRDATGKNSGGATLDGQVGFETDVDWEKLAGITGFSTNTIIVGRYGGLPTSALVGDTLNATQEVYGAGGNVVAHLVQFWGQETLAGGGVQIQAGRIPLDDYFDASPLFCVFASNALCGNPKNFVDNAQSHLTYPDAGWAFHLTLAPSPHYYLQTGIFFNQSNVFNVAEGFRSGWNFDSNYINGETFPVEIGYIPAFGDDKLVGHYKLGFVYDNSSHLDDYYDVAGSSFANTGLPQRMRKGSTTEYIQADQMLIRNGPGPSSGVIVLAGFSYNDPETSYRSEQFYGAVEDLGFWKARPFDQINLLGTYQRVSGLYGKAQGLEFDEGFPILSGGASGVQTWTATFEANYSIHVYHGFTFAPDFQYMIRPNAQSNLPNAAFLGFKTHLEFF